MLDTEHIELLLQQDDMDTLYKIAHDKCYAFDGERLNLAHQQQLSEYIDILRICVKFKDNITATKMHLREYQKAI